MPNKVGRVTPIDRLAENFRRLPGVGKKSAYRMAFAVLDMTDEAANEFAKSIVDAKAKTARCAICQNICEGEICPVCSDDKRDKRLICVLEDPRDVAAVDRIREYNGVYHVLHGVLSPLDGIGPDDITVKELIARIGSLTDEDPTKPIELILATNPNVEGEATAVYIAKLVKPLGVKTTRLAYGIPVGGDLEYADEITLTKAIEGRREL